MSQDKKTIPVTVALQRSKRLALPVLFVFVLGIIACLVVGVEIQRQIALDKEAIANLAPIMSPSVSISIEPTRLPRRNATSPEWYSERVNTTTNTTILSPRTMWAGANTYYLHTVLDFDQDNILNSMKYAHIKMIRLFIRDIGGNTFNSRNLPYSDVQGWDANSKTFTLNYDDSQLEQIDKIMVKVYKAGMKMVIALHDRWALGNCKDVYARMLNYTTTANCTNTTFQVTPTEFYTRSALIDVFDQRIEHILQHTNPYFNNRPWKDLSEVIYAFDIQNEPMVGLANRTSSWLCDRAFKVKNMLTSDILITSGGGHAIQDSVQSQDMRCPWIDVISLHTKDQVVDTVRKDIRQALTTIKSTNSSKLAILESFGAYNISGPYCKPFVIDSIARTCNALNLPWFIWHVSKPATPQDYELYTDDPDSWNVVTSQSQIALKGVSVDEISPIVCKIIVPCVGKCFGEWQFCTENADCRNNCCSNEFSDDFKMKCTPFGEHCGVPFKPLPTSSTCDGGTCKADWQMCTKNSECANECCSNEFSTSDGKMKCTPGGTNCGFATTPINSTCSTPDGKCKADWQLCTKNDECANQCCSNEYSTSDGKMKCTPHGENCGYPSLSSTTTTKTTTSVIPTKTICTALSDCQTGSSCCRPIVQTASTVSAASTASMSYACYPTVSLATTLECIKPTTT